MHSIGPLAIFSLVSAFAQLDNTQAAAEIPRPRTGTYFVATNGNDSWTGSLDAANGSRTDGPFQSIPRALRAAGALKQEQGGSWNQPVSIFIRGGTHFLTEPLVITSRLSGTETASLSIAAFPGERPVVSAGKLISGWKKVTVDGKELWQAEVPEARETGWFFRELWVNGKSRQRARHPNNGYFKIAGLPDVTTNWTKGQMRFSFQTNDLREWKSAAQGEAVVMTRWVESRLPITNIDEQQRVLSSSKRSVFQLSAGDLYYVEGVFEVLDQPGEWFLDRERGIVSYLPLPGESIGRFEVIAPKLSEILRVEGKPESSNVVEYVHFRDLTFSHNEWFFPKSTKPEPEILGFSQAAIGVPGAVNAEGLRYSSFERCRFSNLGSYALHLGRGSQSNLVASCEFSDLGGGGIKIGETAIRANPLEQTHHNTVADCPIHDGGKLFHSAEGIWIGQSFANRLAHNSIHDFFYTGISIGWTWGYKSSAASNNVVEFNHVHHIGQKANGDGPILSDMGGIYTLGGQPGTLIRNNLWHDIFGLRYGGWAIYFDEGSTGIVAENNVAFRTTHGGFHQHYGKENVVRNNVFAFARDHQLQRTRAEEHTSFTFERNIVYFDQGKLLDGDWKGGKFNQDYNVYFDLRTNPPPINVPGGWEKWRAGGHDEHSLIANPRFATTNLANFGLAPDSPARSLGFESFDLRGVGPRKNATN